MSVHFDRSSFRASGGAGSGKVLITNPGIVAQIIGINNCAIVTFMLRFENINLLMIMALNCCQSKLNP